MTEINKLSYIDTDNTIPYKNLALEEHLFYRCQADEVILYLWRNENTIVVGRNQNIWKECLVEELKANGGYPVRRLSGGGAVYHDFGNLNFTFLVQQQNYDVNKQVEVILQAMLKLGIEAEKTGRNDIHINGKKFSGNAFYAQSPYCYHHGTIMINVNLDELTRYLTVSKEKLSGKGVDSIHSRVTNLIDYRPDLTLDELRQALRSAFEEVYGLKSEEIVLSEAEWEDIYKREKRFSSWDWIYGREIPFKNVLNHKFDWGLLEMEYAVNSGIIQDIVFYTDALKTDIFEALPKLLIDIPYEREAMAKAILSYKSDQELEQQMTVDLANWIKGLSM